MGEAKRRKALGEPTKQDFDGMELIFEETLGEEWAFSLFRGAQELQDHFRQKGTHMLAAMMQMELAMREMQEILDSAADIEAEGIKSINRVFMPFTDTLNVIRRKALAENETQH